MKKKLRKEDIQSKKSIIVVFPEKETKTKTLGLVQELIYTDEEIIVDLKPIVYKADFEGDVIRLGIRDDPEKFSEMIKKFESSEHEVLVILGRGRASVMSRNEFNRRLESELHKMVTTKYLQELHKTAKKGYIA